MRVKSGQLRNSKVSCDRVNETFYSVCVHSANDCWSEEQEAESQHAVAKLVFL